MINWVREKNKVRIIVYFYFAIYTNNWYISQNINRVGRF